ncbi:hypothetical protein MTR_7g051330 [Medicago truncatula]|uniref:Uncharacterized protein n=1 Tax=Medicago truncatula TaxID=3880 RepID=G7KWZ2_MEDTR|nr:hypothetical protein MTR_7g051330 [Medicago truncatula]
MAPLMKKPTQTDRNHTSQVRPTQPHQNPPECWQKTPKPQPYNRENSQHNHTTPTPEPTSLKEIETNEEKNQRLMQREEMEALSSPESSLVTGLPVREGGG